MSQSGRYVQGDGQRIRTSDGARQHDGEPQQGHHDVRRHVRRPRYAASARDDEQDHSGLHLSRAADARLEISPQGGTEARIRLLRRLFRVDEPAGQPRTRYAGGERARLRDDQRPPHVAYHSRPDAQRTGGLPHRIGHGQEGPQRLRLPRLLLRQRVGNVRRREVGHLYHAHELLDGRRDARLDEGVRRPPHQHSGRMERRGRPPQRLGRRGAALVLRKGLLQLQGQVSGRGRHSPRRFVALRRRAQVGQLPFGGRGLERQPRTVDAERPVHRQLQDPRLLRYAGQQQRGALPLSDHYRQLG